MTKDAYYFPHDSNAKDDPKCVLLIEQLGLEGYGIFWVLIETLRDQPEYKYPLQLLPALARRYNTTAEKMKTVVQGYGLFEITEDEFFISPSLRERMLKYDEKKEKARMAAKKRWEKELPQQSGRNADALQTQSEPNASRVEYGKVKESKGENSKTKKKFVPPTLEEVKQYFKEWGYKESVAERAYYGYKENNWKDTKGNVVKNWKQKMQNVWFKDEHKIENKAGKDPRNNVITFDK